ncbi:PREDICTED: guanylate kinase-associated protein mars [Rhagoletis zephyria]|uniref:guanylate kinase-associated protein mars n=1 Tax=Rhagoletis zephyria TaxID=28612 RepID=UPI0008116834|nr:PREDICTED: guanylate kinase-associated protein mars [Rhagoletis zephyria]
MDRFRSLYKENSHTLSPVQHNLKNRNIQNANRAKKRREVFESGRNLDVSPTPTKPHNFEEQNLAEVLVDKENKGDALENVAECNKSRIALVASGKTSSKKSTRQESYLLKFIEWREAHKQKEKKRNEIKRRPFISSGGACGSAFESSARFSTVTNKGKSKEVATFVPKGHQRFKPPAGITNPLSEMTSAAKDLLAHDRKSFYTVVPTPPRSKEDNAIGVETKKLSTLSKTPAISNLARCKSAITPATTSLKSTKNPTGTKPAGTKAIKATSVLSTESKPTAVVPPTKKHLTATTGASQKIPSNLDTKSSSNEPVKPEKKTLCSTNKTATSVANVASNISNFNTKSKSNEPPKKTPCNLNKNRESPKKKVPLFVRPQPPKMTTTATRKPISQSRGIATINTVNKPKQAATGASAGAVGKAHMLQSKRAAANASERNKKFATTFKYKKTQVPTLNRPNAPSNITIKGKTLLGGVRTCTADVAFAIAETPTDLLNINTFEPFLTSTRVKSLSPHSANAPNISPVNSEAVNDKKVAGSHQNMRTHSSTSAKRALLTSDTKQNPPIKIQRQKSKFNFVRYSIGSSESDMSPEPEQNGFDAPNISPVNSEAVNDKKVAGSHQNMRTHSSTSAKRALLTSDTKQNPPIKIQRQKSKFNFVRYSIGSSESDMSPEPEQNGFDAPNISPVNSEAVNDKKVAGSHQNMRTHSSTSAKRALLTSDTKQNPPIKIQRQKSKFNFVRYSIGLSELDVSREPEQNGFDMNNSKSASEVGKSVNGTEQITVLEVQPKNTNATQCNAEGNNMSPENKIKNNLDQLKTPPSTENERPVNYIGSFVSVSRGKVSARKEREKRDSIYLPGANDSLTITAAGTPVKKAKTPCKSAVTTPVNIEARRILEAVRYFRQQLSNEIDRLHVLCDQWEEYKQQNLPLLQKSAGEDMINVTIGQTKLLTSKKFQQFKGLIDRCENGARGTAAVYDGSEDTKPITDVDLEGFWSMLNLQVDNVEKRFENLTRWKANNWSDPDEIQETKQLKLKCKPNLTKVKKAKPPAKTAKPSSGLQAMLRKMHAEMRKNKETAFGAGVADENVLVSTPTRQRRSHSGTPKIAGTEQRNSTPRRISVVVRDRKSLSAAATVISLPADSSVGSVVAGNRRHSRFSGESPKSLKASSSELRRSLSNMENAFGGCSDLLRSTLAANAQKLRRRSGTPNFVESAIELDVKQPQVSEKVRTPSPILASAPAANMARKSILKTPGTAKGKPKNVIFNEKLRVKKFKFTIEDDELSDDEEQQMQTSTEEPLSTPRAYSLRTRKVVLRPSSEFVIPFKQI